MPRPDPRILAFAGSTRRGSYNGLLVRVAAEGARLAGADVTVVDLRDHPMPLFDQDLESEQGQPEGARSFRALLTAHDGLLIASPEYNGGITPLLKNALDWASRAADGEPGLAAFRGKTAAIMAASPGGLGGIRALPMVRTILSGMGVLVIPEQVALPRAHEAFDEEGALRDAATAKRVAELGRQVAALCAVR